MPVIKKTFLAATFGVLCCFGSCGDKTVTTTATLMNSTGQTVGTVTFTQTGGDANPVQVDISVNGLPAGNHGVHIHDMGKCDPPDFMTAGGHFNPTITMHGDPNSATHHTGDLGNLVVVASGSGTLSSSSTLMSLNPDNAGYVVGHAFIVHMNADDLVTQPTGNSGARIACGVIPAPAQ